MKTAPFPHCLARHALIAVMASLFFWVGCDLPARPSLKPGTEGRPTPSGQIGTSDTQASEYVESTRKPFSGPWESWNAYFIRGQHVGYRHVVAQSVDDPSSPHVRFQVDDRLIARRGMSSVVQQLSQTSQETADGRIIGFESELRVGPAVKRFVGKFDDGRLRVETIRGSESETVQIDWPANHRGLVAVEESLRALPMKIGEKRTLNMLMPVQHRLATVRLHCNAMASVPMIDGQPQTLLEIHRETQVDGKTTETVLWSDDSGKILRTYAPATRLVSFFTDQETATKDIAKLTDRAARISMEVVGELKKSDTARRVAFSFSPLSQAPSADPILIGPAPDQFVRELPDGQFQVLVSRQSEEVANGFVGSNPAVEPGDLKAESYIDFKSPRVRRIADAAVVGRRDLSPRDAALELTSTVHALISPREQYHGFSMASEVAQEGVGDCAEFAVLLAAILRAREIPSKLAVGLVYVPGDQPRMDYHVWTLAHIDGQWLPLDATIGKIAPADRITMATTNLGEKNEYKVFAPMLHRLGNVKIEIVGAGY